MRFRKSKKFGNLRINISKSGIGASVGIKGLRAGISSSKGAYTAYGLPGTGIYDVKYHSKKSKNNSSDSSDSPNYEPNISANTDYFKYKEIPDEFKNNTNNLAGCSNPIGCLWGIVSFILLVACFPLGIISIIVELITYNYINNKAIKEYEKTGKYRAKLLYKSFLDAIKQKNYSTGKNIIKQLIEMYPEMNRLKQDYTECCLLDEDYEGAYNSLCSYCSSASEIIEVMNLAFHIENYEAVIEHSKKLGKTLHSDMRVVVLLYECYDRLERYDELIEYLQGLNDTTKSDVRVITFLGLTYLKLKKYDLALEVLKQGPTRKREMDDNMAKFRYCLGLAYEFLGKKKDALKQYNKIVVYNAKFEDIEEKIKKLSE